MGRYLTDGEPGRNVQDGACSRGSSVGSLRRVEPHGGQDRLEVGEIDVAIESDLVDTSAGEDEGVKPDIPVGNPGIDPQIRFTRPIHDG